MRDSTNGSAVDLTPLEWEVLESYRDGQSRYAARGTTKHGKAERRLNELGLLIDPTIGPRMFRITAEGRALLLLEGIALATAACGEREPQRDIHLSAAGHDDEHGLDLRASGPAGAGRSAMTGLGEALFP